MKEEILRRPPKRQRRSTDSVFSWTLSSSTLYSTLESSMGTPSSKVESRTEVSPTTTSSPTASPPSSPILSKSKKEKMVRTIDYNIKRQEVFPLLLTLLHFN